MKISKYLIILILIILTCPFIIKYVYVQHNQFEQIPLILRYINPNFLQNDWVTNINSVFSPRYFFTLYMGNLARFISLPIAYFTNYLLTIALVTFATYLLTKKVFNRDFIAILTTIVILYGQKITLGGNDLVGRDFDPSRMAFGFVVLGITLLLYNKYFLSGILFAIAAYLHPLIGFEIPPIIYFAKILVDYLQKPKLKSKPILSIVKPYLKSISIYLLISSFAIYQYLLTHSQNEVSNIPKDILSTIIFKIRLSSHYYPLSFPIADYLKFITLIVFLVIFIRKKLFKIDSQLLSFIKITILIIFLLCLTAGFFTLVIPFYPIIILQLFRLTVIVYWFSAIIVYGFCFYLGSDQLKPAVYRLALLLFAFILSYPDILNIKSKSNLVFIILVIIWGVIYPQVLKTKEKLLIVILPVLFYAILYRHYQFQFQQPYPFETAETSIALWAKNNTSLDSISLIPPSFYSFKLVSERAIIADWMSGPYREKEILVWFERITDISGLSHYPYSQISEQKINEGYKQIDLERVKLLRTKYVFNYVITENPTQLPLPLVYQNELYSVYQTQ